MLTDCLVLALLCTSLCLLSLGCRLQRSVDHSPVAAALVLEVSVEVGGGNCHVARPVDGL
jgi:hypothetical protein